MACVPLLPTAIIEPSGVERAAYSDATTPFALGRLSTMTFWRSASPSLGDITRAMKSAGPPAAFATMICMGFAGNTCDRSGAGVCAATFVVRQQAAAVHMATQPVLTRSAQGITISDSPHEEPIDYRRRNRCQMTAAVLPPTAHGDCTAPMQ